MNLFAYRSVRTLAFLLSIVPFSSQALTAASENLFWNQFGQTPVQAELVNGSNKQSVTLKSYEADILMVEMSFDGSVAEIGMPSNQTLLRQLRIPIPEMNSIEELLKGKQYAAALKKLRPSAYPLLNYYTLPSTYAVVHKPVYILLEALIDKQLLDEASDLFQRISLQQAPLYYCSIVKRRLLQ